MITGFSTAAGIAFFLLTFMALVKYCRKWIVVRQFKHVTPESWVPRTLFMGGHLLINVGMVAGLFKLATSMNLAMPFWLWLLIAAVLGPLIALIVIPPLAKLRSSLEERISQKRRGLGAASKHTPQ